MRQKICTPVYRRELVEPRMVASVMALLADPAFAGSEWQWVEGTVISYNRNVAMIKGTPLSEFSHILFVDSDTVFRPAHVRQLLARDVDVVSAAVEARGFPGKVSAAVSCEVPDADRCRPSMSDTGLREVVWVGAGMLLVRAAVFAGWDNPWRYGTMDNGLQIGEDVQLCLDLRERGHTIWLDHDCRVEHILTHGPDGPQRKGTRMDRQMKRRDVEDLAKRIAAVLKMDAAREFEIQYALVRTKAKLKGIAEEIGELRRELGKSFRALAAEHGKQDGTGGLALPLPGADLAFDQSNEELNDKLRAYLTEEVAVELFGIPRKLFDGKKLTGVELEVYEELATD